MGKKTNFKTSVVMSLFLLAIVSTAGAEIIYVDADASTAGDGQSWGTAYKYLQDALAVAVSGDEIWVAAGVYKPDEGSAVTPGDREATFQIINSVALKGGYAGYGSADPNARDIELYETILSGDLKGDDSGFSNSGDNSYHVVTGAKSNTNSILGGFTVTSGNAYATHSRGGGINIFHGSIVNCTITFNQAQHGGGVNSCDGYITSCIISNNYARDFGGGLHVSSATVSNSSIINNEAYRGGGLGANGGFSIVLFECVIAGNSADNKGGGLYMPYGTIDSCIIERNQAPLGGAFYGGTGVISNCIIRDNEAKGAHIGFGGGFYFCKAELRNCVITDNWSIGEGGALYGHFGLITNCTITNNRSEVRGGGMVCFEFPGYSQKVTNSTFWANQSPQGSQIALISSEWGLVSYAVHYCDVQGGLMGVYVDPNCTLIWGTGNIDADPLFVDAASGNYHLLPDSPCIDAGDNNSIPADTSDLDGDGNTTEPIPFDLDGNPRIVNCVDMGAFEAQLLDPAELLLDLAQDVIALNLQNGIENSLDGKLDAALKALEDINENNNIAAINTLQAFINAVEAQRGNKIPEADADALIAVVQAIIDLLSGT